MPLALFWLIMCFALIAPMAFTATGKGVFTPEVESSIRSRASSYGAANEYVRYRNLAIQAAVRLGVTSGTISNVDIGLTPDAALNASNRVESGVLYVWAQLDPEVGVDVNRRLGSPATFGVNRSGAYFTAAYGNMSLALPAYIPNGYYVTVAQLN